MHLVFGIGSTELINAALYALSQHALAQAQPCTCDAPPCNCAPAPAPEGHGAAVWAAAPFYSGYVEPGSYFQTRLFHWHEGATPPVATAEMPVLEMVTSPNNPDGTPAV